MELVDYARRRAIVLGTALAIGLASILLLGASSGGDVSEASARIIVRPPGSEVRFTGDTDRFIDTDILLLQTRSTVEAIAARAEVEPDVVAAGLTYEHAEGSDVVNVRAQAGRAGVAVDVANAAAAYYIDDLSRRATAPTERELERVNQEILEVSEELSSVNRRLFEATESFREDNPEASSVPPASALRPELAIDQTLLQSRLQGLGQQQTTLSATATATAGSRIVSPAREASAVGGWGATVYLAAVFALVLLLVSAAAAGLALTRRMVSPSRWRSETDTFFRPPVELRGEDDRARRRLMLAVESLKQSGDTLELVLLPGESARLRTVSEWVESQLSDWGVEVDVRDLDAFFATSDSSPTNERGRHADSTGVLLLVDLWECRSDDILSATTALGSVRGKVTPLLTR